MSTSSVQAEFLTSGIVRLTRPQLVGTMLGLLLSVLLASLDQTIVGTAEPRIIAQLSGFDRYPWVSTNYLLTSTLAIPIFARLSDIYGRKWFFLSGAAMFIFTSALCGASGDAHLPAHRRHESVDRVPRTAGHRRRHDDGACVHHHRRCFFARRARQVSGLFRGDLWARFHLRSHPGRSAHRPRLLARLLLCKPACRNHRHHCHLARIPLLEAGRC